MIKYFNLFMLFLGMTINGCTTKNDAGETGLHPIEAGYPTYEGDDLELVYTPAQSDFTLWSPQAKAVKLKLYNDGQGGSPVREESMKQSDKGTWRFSVKEDLKGKFYTFQVQTDTGWRKETPGIWAKAVGVNGDRAAIIDWKETHPVGWESDKAPDQDSFADIMIYEMHHRDFSIAYNSGIENRGKYMALTEEGTTSPEGKKTGIDHLKELGVTHIHILPSYDFGSIDETRLEDNVYNWGYDPKNYNVPEGSYSTDPYDPVTRIREFKEMVLSLHKNGIRVILDVVYNHTYVNDDSNFSLTVPGYFYRYRPDGSYSDAFGCGNETASEHPMMRRFIIESVKYWAREYHIDGFRFDLMGIHDIETMNEVTAALREIDPAIFVYGEGWTASSSPLPVDQLAIKANAPKLHAAAVFSDDIRDALKGSVFEEKQAGFVSGIVEGNEETVKFGIVGAITHPQIDYNQILYCDAPYANDPVQVINYVSCHDDLCLVDKLKLSAPSGTTENDLKKFNKLAQTIIFTSQGIPFMRAGEELFHDKQGVHNSYKSPDHINQIDWTLKTRHADIFSYYQGLIALRKDNPAFRLSKAADVQQALRFIQTRQPGLIAYTLTNEANRNKGDLFVVFNGNREDCTLTIPAADWQVVVKDGCIDTNGSEIIKGGNTKISASSALILRKK